MKVKTIYFLGGFLIVAGAAAGKPAHADRTMPPNCADPLVVADMQRITAHSLEPFHIDLLEVVSVREGMFEGDEVCVASLVTSKGELQVAYFGQVVAGKVYGRVKTYMEN